MNNLRVSIIVPVYKAEKFLGRCVDSILSQSMTSWELLLIDDGSPDGSGILCDYYAKKDNRIQVFHKQNGGVSSARNLGMGHAKAEFITFIDADDYIDNRFLELMLDDMSSDLVICGFNNRGNDCFTPNRQFIGVLDDSSVINELVEIPYYLDTPWCKLFKTEIIRNNRLCFNPKLKLSEDTLFCYQYLVQCRTIRIISEALYFYDGLWGGGSKYELSYEELNYASKKCVDAIREINRRFKFSISTKYKCFHLSKLRGLFENYTDVDVYNLYCHSHDAIPIEVFLGDFRLSPLTIGFNQLRELAVEGNKFAVIDLLKKIKRFTTTPISSIHFVSPKQKFFYRILNILGVMPSYLLLKFISKSYSFQ